jgi:hypothetical protein
MEEEFDLTIDDLDYEHCPLCDSENVVHGPAEFIPGTEYKMLQECYCEDCHATWQITGIMQVCSFECIQDGDGNEICDLVD